MTHYLRRQTGENIAEVETFTKEGVEDVSASIYIENYSDHLLYHTKFEDQLLFVRDMDNLHEIRGYVFEMLPYDGSKLTPKEYITNQMKHLADKWELNYVTD